MESLSQLVVASAPSQHGSYCYSVKVPGKCAVQPVVLRSPGSWVWTLPGSVDAVGDMVPICISTMGRIYHNSWL